VEQQQQAAAAASTKKTFAVKASHSGHVAASPLAKAIAREAQVDLSVVVGTGPEGRVIAADVREFVESRPLVADQGAAGYAMQGGFADHQAFYEDVEISQMRRVIGQRLLQSKQTIPHYYLSMDCDVGSLISLRQSVNASITESSKGSKVSLNDFVIKAAALACQAVPECNAEWRDDCIRLHKNVNVGVAMDLGILGHSQGGLVVPVVRHVHTKGVAAIAKDVKTYASKAKALEGADGKMRLSLEEMEGGTFTVSNLGMFGVKQFAAIVNPPQSCILAVGTVRNEVKKGEAEGDFQEAKIMNVTLSCDHRVVDGAVGAKWLQEFKALIENPLQMLI
jgi:pyruvate dehydrogenase E2 component (dihydrolipoamide acetyltransferase)